MLDLDKTKWRPGDALPSWWGNTGSVCGGTVALKRDGVTETWVPVLCKRWCCDVCSYYRHAWLVRNIVEAAVQHRMRWFWTFTLSSRGRDREAAHAEIRRAFKLLAKRLEYERPGLEYIWVCELHESGYPHLHVLWNQWRDVDVVRAHWLDITGDSVQIRAERVAYKRVAHYVAKYVGKEARQRRLNSSAEVGLRCFSKSAGIEFSEFMPRGPGWQVVQMSWAENAAWLRKHALIGEDRGIGIPRIVCMSTGQATWLRAWGEPQTMGPGLSGGARPPPRPPTQSVLAARRRLGLPDRPGGAS